MAHEQIIEIKVCMKTLTLLKRYYHKSKGCRVMFSNSEGLLIRLPSGAEILYHQQLPHICGVDTCGEDGI